MEIYTKLFYLILHTFTGCPDKDLDWFKDAKGICRKCGRTYFGFHV